MYSFRFITDASVSTRPAFGGALIRRKSKRVAVRPLKIRFNPQNPCHPCPHYATRGVAKQNKMVSDDQKIHFFQNTLTCGLTTPLLERGPGGEA